MQRNRLPEISNIQMTQVFHATLYPLSCLIESSPIPKLSLELLSALGVYFLSLILTHLNLPVNISGYELLDL
jgi:hypothetical protein